MKVALLLSGLARNVKGGYEQYWKPIIDNYDTDVYLHYWEDREHEEVLKVYNPKKYVCDPPKWVGEYQKTVRTINDKMVRPDPRYGVAGNYYMYLIIWGWQQSFNLIEGEYDCIIKSRYDMGYGPAPDLTKLDMTKLNVGMSWPGTPIPDDNLLITNQSLATQLYTDIYPFWERIAEERGYIEFPEKNFQYLLERKDMYKYLHKTPIIHFGLIRENIVWY